MSPHCKVSILILNWNNAKDTLECLESLKKITYPNFDVIVIDNGSTDDSASQIKNAFPHIDLIQNGDNLGYAEGNNKGMRYALDKGADYLFLLNNDTVVHPQILDAFVAAAESHPEGGVFGAKIYYFEDPVVIWYAGGYVHPVRQLCIHEGCQTTDLEKKYETIQETGFACGCALFIRRDVALKVGLMDPRFFLIWEEIDWCYRIKNAGYLSFFVPDAKVWHKISSSFEGGHRGPSWHYYYFRNRLLFLKLHLPLRKRLKFYTGPFLSEFLSLITSIISPHTPPHIQKLDKSVLRGIFDYFCGRLGKIK